MAEVKKILAHGLIEKPGWVHVIDLNVTSLNLGAFGSFSSSNNQTFDLGCFQKSWGLNRWILFITESVLKQFSKSQSSLQELSYQVFIVVISKLPNLVSDTFDAFIQEKLSRL